MEQKNETSFSTDDARWDALVRREPRAVDSFVYGVVTTGIYCRPTCASRIPKRENVRFFDSWQEAERAGFRPCKRCLPNRPEAETTQAEAIRHACELIDAAETSPSLNDLAAAVGLSPFHFHRLFKKIVGITPKQYAMEKRAERMRAQLQQDTTVTDAIYNAGFASGSRFYEKATATLGMKPSAYQNGAQDVPIRAAVVHAYLGWMLVAATPQGICAIEFGDAPEVLQERLRHRFPKAEIGADDPVFEALVTRLLDFLEAPHRHSLDLPLDIQGTAFQRRVWLALQEIPTGSTASYTEIAARIGNPKAVRAVAQACAANPVAVAIPCHRVVRSDGELGGYHWGVERKRALLEREKGI